MRAQAEWQADPGSADVSRVCLERSPCDDFQVAQYSQMASDGWRVENAVPVPVVKAEYENAVEVNGVLTVRIMVTLGDPDFEGAGAVIVDSDDNVLAALDVASSNTRARWRVAQNDAGEWRVWQLGE